MKKIIVFWLILILPIFVLAQEYEESDINLKIDVNDRFIVLSRDNLADNPDLEKLNLTEENMKNIMEKNNIYFDIINNDVSYEIVIVVPQTKLDFDNLTEVNDLMLDNLKSELVKKTGAQASYIYKGNYNYVVVDYHDENSGYNVINYYTVMNKRGYNVQLQKKGEILEEDKNNLREIVDSISIKSLAKPKENSNKVDNNKKTIDVKIIICGVVIGAIAGVITYYIGINIKKRKSSR